MKIGDKPKSFRLPDQDGDGWRLEEHLGKWVVVYFYPKDDTPGCRAEACGFRDGMDELKEAGVEVVGISMDSVESHRKFADKHGLNFGLLADVEGRVVREWGALVEKSVLGRKVALVRRMSYLIDPDGRVARVYAKVKPSEHAGEILKDVVSMERV